MKESVYWIIQSNRNLIDGGRKYGKFATKKEANDTAFANKERYITRVEADKIIPERHVYTTYRVKNPAKVVGRKKHKLYDVWAVGKSLRVMLSTGIEDITGCDANAIIQDDRQTVAAAFHQELQE